MVKLLKYITITVPTRQDLMNLHNDRYRITAANTGFASGGLTYKLEVLCFYSSLAQVDSFVLRNPPERKARTRCRQTTIPNQNDKNRQKV